MKTLIVIESQSAKSLPAGRPEAPKIFEVLNQTQDLKPTCDKKATNGFLDAESTSTHPQMSQLRKVKMNIAHFVNYCVMCAIFLFISYILYMHYTLYICIFVHSVH